MDGLENIVSLLCCFSHHEAISSQSTLICSCQIAVSSLATSLVILNLSECKNRYCMRDIIVCMMNELVTSKYLVLLELALWLLDYKIDNFGFPFCPG